MNEIKSQLMPDSIPPGFEDIRKSLPAFPLSRIRLAVQACIALICIYTAYRFYYFHLWATDRSEIYTARPPSVEAFLPISALLGLKRLTLTGQWDGIHPAGLAILIAALAIALILRKGFCGWICPVGFLSNLTERLGKPIRFFDNAPPWLDYPLLSLKYILLGFFCWAILWSMDIRAIEAFLYSPYNLVADAKMLLFFLDPSLTVISVLGFLFLISLFIRNFWCRYLCPYGALLGLLAVFSPVRINRSASRCIDCKKCDKVCPASIKVSRSTVVRHAECIGCVECVPACPQKNCLTLAGPLKKRIPVLAMPVSVVGLFLLIYLGAVLTGHWNSRMPPEVVKQFYGSAATFTHP
jgi:NAD-dependent dihydropyrimidine dehydrogenase PreA subunit